MAIPRALRELRATIGASLPRVLIGGHHTVRQAKLARSNGCKSRPGKA
jgi:hypothetical protein